MEMLLDYTVTGILHAMDPSRQEFLIDHLATDTSIPITQNEIAQLRQSIQEAQYFDHTSMAALTPASLVSIKMYVRYTTD